MEWLLVVVLIVVAIYLSRVDNTDRVNPFGTDTVKNQKYAGKNVGEDFGVGTFWGRPSKSDDTRSMIDKIQWLSSSWNNDTLWRRSLTIGIFASMIILLGLNPKMIMEPCKLLFTCFTVFIITYFTLSYYHRHFLWRRTKFIDTHITRLKEKLKLPLYNKIALSPLI
jgi:hypothetical protein